MNLVTTQRYGAIAVVTLAHAARRNAISLQLADDLVQALTDVDDGATHAVVITGEGSTFCSGADRNALQNADEKTLRRIYSAFLTVRKLGLPTVAAVNGPAVGAGFNLALACDVRIAAESAVFESRFLSIPIHPGGGHTWMLERATSPVVAGAMTLFGEPVSGRRAFELGLAWDCVPDQELLPRSIEFCSKLAAAPLQLIREIKQTLSTAPEFADHEEANEYEFARQVASTRRREYRAAFGGRARG